MGNKDTALGFQEVASYSGGNRSETELAYVDSDNATAIFHGDPLELEDDGNVKPALAGAGVKVSNIAVGFLDENYVPLSYLPKETTGFVISIPVKGRKFFVQASTGVAVAATDRNATADFVIGTGNESNGRSKYELDSSTIGTGQQCRIWDKANFISNQWGEHVVLVVSFVESAYEDNTTI